MLLLFVLVGALRLQADTTTTPKPTHWGWEVAAVPGWVIAADPYEKKWLKGKFAMALKAGVRYAPLPQDSDAYAEDYGYPVLTAGLMYGMNHGVTMHRDEDPAWGQLVPVDYTSHMGNTLTLYTAFERPFFRNRRWQADYTLSAGVGYTPSKYNTTDAIDNELIGSHWLIYFGAGLHASYHFSPRWALRVGLEFYHHSNGALARPNKGANVVAPSLALVYEPYYEALTDHHRHAPLPPFHKYNFIELALGIGAKTLNEEWQLTQFQTPPSNPNYRTSHFRLYPSVSFQTAFLRRYARRWASGGGIDIFYGSYAQRVEEIDRMQGNDVKHSPWSIGLSAKHRVYFHNLALHLSLGYYLYRHMGHNAKQVETPYYEHIGLHYSFPSLGHLTVGIDVKAHKTKADYTELVVAYPITIAKPTRP